MLIITCLIIITYYLLCVQTVLDTVHLQSPTDHSLILVQDATPSHPASNLNTLAQPLTLDTLGQSQSPLHIPADGLETVLELLVALVLLTAAGVIATVVLVTTFGHGRDADVKLEKTGLSLFIMYLRMTFK